MYKRQGIGRPAIACDIDQIAGLAQCPRHTVGQQGIIFDKQYPHHSQSLVRVAPYDTTPPLQMNRMRHLLAAILLLPAALLAQTTPQRLTLAEAEALWQEHNRELQLARTAVSGAEADVLSAGQRPNPQVSLNITQIAPWSGYGLSLIHI